MKFLTSFILSLFICNITLANNYKQHYLRGDANIQFQWRLGYSEYTSNNSSQTDIEDIIKGNYSWYDPDVNSFGSDASRRGVDVSSYPSARTFNFGIQLSF